MICIETEGDSNASVTRVSDGSNFDVYSPFKYTIKYASRIKYLEKDLFETEDSQTGDEPTISRIIERSDDFVTEEMKEYFEMEDRDQYINIDFKDISMNPAILNEKAKYILRYDQPRYSVSVDSELTEKRNTLWLDAAEAGIQAGYKDLETEPQDLRDQGTLRGSNEDDP